MPKRAPNRRARTRRLTVEARQVIDMAYALVLASGWKWTPKCGALRCTLMPNLRIDVETAVRTVGSVIAATDLPFPVLRRSSC